MTLRRLVAELNADLRDRVVVSWHHDTWHVTAGSFASALDYVEARFENATVLARHDHGRRWSRVTLEISTDPARAAEAPPLSDLANPPEPPTDPEESPDESEPVAESDLPADLEAIFARQNDVRRR